MWDVRSVQSTAFMLGNGRSRERIDPKLLNGKIYGCNAIYREHDVEVLVSTDPGISKEIQTSGYPLQHRHYTRDPFLNSGSMKIEQYYMWSSGPIALNYACLDGHTDIFILGVDFGSQNDKFSNMYADTDHYKSSQAEPTFYGNWINQFWEVMRSYPQKNFIRVIDDWCEIPEKWEDLENVTHKSIEDFLVYIETFSLDK